VSGLVIGTAGHIDHGKTALVRALTGVDTDRLPEERRRGITIDLGFARLALGSTAAAVVDVPGHEAFIRNMVAGAAGVDVGLLVVAADDGVMPQTREHLDILDLLGVPALVVALTKTDLVDAEWLELAAADVAQLLEGSRFRAAPVVPVSASQGLGLGALREALERAAPLAGARAADDVFRLPIDRVFTIRGTGTVVTGTIWTGRLAADATVRLLPHGERVRVRGLQVHGAPVAEAVAGCRAAVAIVRERHGLERGSALVEDGRWEAVSRLVARARLLPAARRPLRARTRVRVHLATAEVMARAVPLDGAELLPGQDGWVELRLERPVTARAGDRFVLRAYSPVTTIGGGTVVELDAGRRRPSPSLDRHLATLLDGDARTSVAARLADRGWSGDVRAALAWTVRGGRPAIQRAVQALLADGSAHEVGTLLFGDGTWQAARTLLLQGADDAHAAQPLRPATPRLDLRRLLPRGTPDVLADAVLDDLVRSGELEVRDGDLARPGFRAAVSPDLAPLRDRVLTLLREARLAVPHVDEMPADVRQQPGLWALLRLLERDGAVVALAPGLYADPSTIAEAVRAVRTEMPVGQELRLADFREVLGLSRKHLLPLLGFLDQCGVTRRVGETRVLAGPEAAGPVAAQSTK
jgi:selenocysteine-specific elongation factor